MDPVHEQILATEATFWRTSLLRTIKMVTTLVMMSLVLRGHREHVDHGDCHGDNFLALVAMQARFDPVLQQPPPLSTSNPGSNSEVTKPQ